MPRRTPLPPPIPTTLRCRTCNQVKAASPVAAETAFYRSAGAVSGYQTDCKPCHNRQRELRRKTHDAILRTRKAAQVAALAAVAAPPAALAQLGHTAVLPKAANLQTLFDVAVSPYLADLFETAICLALGKPRKLKPGQVPPDRKMLEVVLERTLGRPPDRSATIDDRLVVLVTALTAAGPADAPAGDLGADGDLGAALSALEAGGLSAEPGAIGVSSGPEPCGTGGDLEAGGGGAPGGQELFGGDGAAESGLALGETVLDRGADV